MVLQRLGGGRDLVSPWREERGMMRESKWEGVHGQPRAAGFLLLKLGREFMRDLIVESLTFIGIIPTGNARNQPMSVSVIVLFYMTRCHRKMMSL